METCVCPVHPVVSCHDSVCSWCYSLGTGTVCPFDSNDLNPGPDVTCPLWSAVKSMSPLHVMSSIAIILLLNDSLATLMPESNKATTTSLPWYPCYGVYLISVCHLSHNTVHVKHTLLFDISVSSSFVWSLAILSWCFFFCKCLMCHKLKQWTFLQESCTSFNLEIRNA